MTLMTRLIGAALVLLLVVAFLSLGESTGIYIDLPGLVFVLGVMAGGLLMCFGPKQIGDAAIAAFRGSTAPPTSEPRRKMRAAVFARAYRLSWGAGLVGTLIAAVAILADMHYSAANIGAGFAVALMTTLYGALLAELVFSPMQQAVLNTGEEVEEDPPTPTASC